MWIRNQTDHDYLNDVKFEDMIGWRPEFKPILSLYSVIQFVEWVAPRFVHPGCFIRGNGNSPVTDPLNYYFQKAIQRELIYFFSNYKRINFPEQYIINNNLLYYYYTVY